jgi:hypothetical protein
MSDETGPAVAAEVRTALLSGTLDADNPLSALRGNGLVWSEVFRRADADERRRWFARNLETARDNAVTGCITPIPHWNQENRPVFPEPRGLNVNMMPIKIWDLARTLPPELAGYVRMIHACPIVANYDSFQSRCEWENRVVYLTVHESLVPAGAPQRRAGLHVERPGAPRDRLPAEALQSHDCPVTGKPRLAFHSEESQRYRMLAWGLGFYDYQSGIPIDGIYIASSVAGTTRVWDALLNDPHEVTDAHGAFAPKDDEHLRSLLGEGRTLAAGELCWITDRTPHEALAAPSADGESKATYRQFFRLVVGRISRWYTKHNTVNPLCPLPADVEVSDEDKFAAA